MAIRQVFWDSGPPRPFKSGSRFYREGEVIHLEVEDFDAEDNRRYDFQIEFAVAEYKRALQEIQEKGQSSIKGPNWELDLSFQRDKRKCHLFLHGTPSPATSPGGGQIFSGINLGAIDIDKLLLDENCD